MCSKREFVGFEKRVWVVPRSRPDRAVVEKAAEWIRAAERPLIVAGGGTLYSGATEAEHLELIGTRRAQDLHALELTLQKDDEDIEKLKAYERGHRVDLTDYLPDPEA